MLIQEARWLQRAMQQLGYERLCPLLNVGSNTAQFREQDQPWIDRCLFAPLRRRGLAVVHVDLQNAPGVDFVGDVCNPAFLERLSNVAPRAVLCSNLLEHVPDPAVVARNLLELAGPGGHLIVSCPHEFPYHPDPIDTRFRPGIQELARLFPGTEAVAQEVVNCGTGLELVVRESLRRPQRLWRAATSLLKRRDPAQHDPGQSARSHMLRWLHRRLSATCLLLRVVEKQAYT